MSVVIRVMFSGFFRVVLGLQMVAMGHMSVMRGLLVITCLAMFGGGTMVIGGVLMMLRGFVMVFNVCIGHGNNPFWYWSVSTAYSHLNGARTKIIRASESRITEG